MTRIGRYKTDDMPRPNVAIRSAIERNVALKWFLKVIGVFGVALLLAGERSGGIPGPERSPC
jgi:hypothetical protein